MNCENCNCPLEKGDFKFCNFCEQQEQEQERLEREEYEEQIEKALKSGVPIDKVREVVQLIYFE